MAAAYNLLFNGVEKQITRTALTNPEIAKNNPHGPGRDASGAVNKTAPAGRKSSTSTTSGK